MDQVIRLNQAGKTSDTAIRDSLELLAREVMPEFHAAQPEQDAWKQDVLDGRIVLEGLDTSGFDLYAHQTEDTVRLTPEQLKQRRQAKERAATGYWTVQHRARGGGAPGGLGERCRCPGGLCLSGRAAKQGGTQINTDVAQMDTDRP